MLMDPMGGIVMTNDGNAILREITVEHPAAKSMIEIARTQDEEVGDGTTSVIILGKNKVQHSGFPLDLENLEKWGYTWKTWKYHGILKKKINIMEKWHETWKNLMATKNSLLTPLKQHKIH